MIKTARVKLSFIYNSMVMKFPIICLVFLIIFSAAGRVWPQEATRNTQENPNEDAPQTVKDLLVSNIRAQGMAARLYDTDGDGVIQPAEMESLLDDIMSFVARRGGYVLQEDVAFLRVFDRDNNGLLDRQECWSIKKALLQFKITDDPVQTKTP